MNSLGVIVPDYDDPRVACATEVEIGVWNRLIVYCSLMENGGVIRGCRKWSAREWLMTVKVDFKNVTRDDCPLWEWSGDDLTAILYRTEYEDRVRMRREMGSRGGKAKAKKARAEEGSVANAIANAKPNAVANALPITEQSRAEHNNARSARMATPDAAFEGGGGVSSHPDHQHTGRWPPPFPDAVENSDLKRIQEVWFDDTGGNEHFATWHRENHGSKPMPTLPDDYPPPPNEEEVPNG